MKSYKESYNIINSYHLIKDHKKLLKFLVSEEQRSYNQKDRFDYLLSAILGLDNGGLTDLLVANKSSFRLIENNSSVDFEKEMFILIYLVSIGLLK